MHIYIHFLENDYSFKTQYFRDDSTDLAGNVDPCVRGEVTEQADPDTGVDGGQQGLGQEAEVEAVLDPQQRHPQSREEIRYILTN